MGRQLPMLQFTREEWAALPPEACLEAAGRRFTYVVRLVPRGGGLPPREERILYEVQLVDAPVPNHGLPVDA